MHKEKRENRIWKSYRFPIILLTGIAVGREYVDAYIDLVKSVNPEIMVLPSAGISCGNDCYNIIMAGADGSGSSSGICKAEDPAAMAEEMMAAVRKAYDERNK